MVIRPFSYFKIYIFSKNPNNPTIARIIAKATPMPKIIVFPFPPDDVPNFNLNPLLK